MDQIKLWKRDGYDVRFEVIDGEDLAINVNKNYVVDPETKEPLGVYEAPK